MKRFLQLMAAQNSAPQWMRDAAKTYGIPLANLKAAYAIDEDIKKSFDGSERKIVGNGGYFDTNVIYSGVYIHFKTKYTKNLLECNAFGVDLMPNQGTATIREMHGNIYNNNCYVGNSKILTNIICYSKQEIYQEIEISENVRLKVNDTTYYAEGVNGWDGAHYSDYLFATNCKGNATYIMSGSMKYFQSLDADGNTIHMYIPIKQTDGTCTMIDLITMEYPTKVGTFTIE